ncbi:MAG: hypothetical protein AB7J13_00835 [Pyrinomonadaceae bacterium]
MRFRVLIGILLLNLGFAVPFWAQPDQGTAPVTRREVRRWLNVTQDDPVLSQEANEELIAAIRTRGVNFVLTPEEEWAFQLLEASDELIEAIRDAVPADQREAMIRATQQRRLYDAFASNYRLTDINSRRTALDAGKEFVQRYRGDPELKDVVSFINRYLPQLQRSVQMMERTQNRTRRGKN